MSCSIDSLGEFVQLILMSQLMDLRKDFSFFPPLKGNRSRNITLINALPATNEL